MDSGTLYVVATPIGNLGDLSPRAAAVLREVALIAAEDTRVTSRLAASAEIDTPMLSLHEHNEARRADELLARLQAGESIALVSDAGTPLVSDPGYLLVRRCVEAGVPVRPVPGPSALTAALSVSGLATDRFRFEGFLPGRGGARRRRLDELAVVTVTLIFYEAPHRIAAALADLAERLGGERRAWVGRELTKRFESHRAGTLAELAALFAAGEEPGRGEFVIVVAGAEEAPAAHAFGIDELLRVLLAELPAARAARVAASLTKQPRRELYRRALTLSDDAGSGEGDGEADAPGA